MHHKIHAPLLHAVLEYNPNALKVVRSTLPLFEERLDLWAAVSPSAPMLRRKQLDNSYRLDQANDIARSDHVGRAKIRLCALTCSPSQYLRRHLSFSVPA